MDRAFNSINKTIEYAYQLKQKGAVYYTKYSKHYQCPNPYCREKAAICAFIDRSKVQPHFRYNKHLLNCIFDKSFGIKKVKNKDESYSWVLPYVTEIDFPNTFQHIDYTKNKSTYLGSSKLSTSNSSLSGQRIYQRTSYLSATAFFYLQDPKINGKKSLILLKCKSTYRGHFQKIINTPNIKYLKNKVFYNELRYTVTPVYSEDKILITLNEIDPITGKFFELHLRTKEWSNQHVQGVKEEISSILNEVEQLDCSPDGKCITIFFIGEQSNNQSNIFYCDYAEFYFVYIGKPVKLLYNNFGIIKTKQVIKAVNLNIMDNKYNQLLGTKINPTTPKVSNASIDKELVITKQVVNVKKPKLNKPNESTNPSMLSSLLKYFKKYF